VEAVSKVGAEACGGAATTSARIAGNVEGAAEGVTCTCGAGGTGGAGGTAAGDGCKEGALFIEGKNVALVRGGAGSAGASSWKQSPQNPGARCVNSKST